MMALGGAILDEASPTLDSFIGTGLRLTASITPVVDDDVGVTFSLRKLKGKIQQIELQKEREVLINYALIREAMMDFFTGWMEQMNVLECDLSKQVKAREEFNNILSTLTSTNK